MTYIRYFILAFNYFCMAYTLVLSVLYLIQLIMSFVKINKNKKRKQSDDYDKYIDSENLVPISLLIPAHNEEDNIVHNVKSLLKQNYPEFELVVVNDGSRDSTHSKMLKEFQLYPIEVSTRVSIPTKNVRGVYYNIKYPNLIYVDKENGGKSDALNAGINYSRYPLFASLDADSRLESDALLKLGNEFIKNTNTVVAGGLVRIANGSIIEDGEWKGFEMPKNFVERFQIVEYFRSFLSGRVSWGVTNSMLIVSGAFGVFKKQTVIDVGGFKTDTIGEDMEIVVRIHKHMRQKRQKYAVIFNENAVCWTQGPMTFRDLKTQRQRWQIGLFDTLINYKSLFLNPRFGIIGLFAVPYNWAFEFLGAIIEAIGYLIIPFSFLMGELNPFFFVVYLLLAMLLGIILSCGGLILEQRMETGTISAKQCVTLSIYAILENLGYRQAITLFRAVAIFSFRKRRNSWGTIRRKQFNKN